MAVAGQDYCVVAASTRMSTGFSILKRDSSLFMQLCGLEPLYLFLSRWCTIVTLGAG